MNRKRWLLVALFVGCGAGAATMTVAVPTYTFYSSSNGKMEVTLDGTEYIETFAHGVSDPVTGKYPYIIPADSIPDIHTATYTGTVSIVLGLSGDGQVAREVIGGCTVVVNAENQTSTWDWFDGLLSPDGPGL